MKYIIWMLLAMQVTFAEGIESINAGEKISGSVEKLEKKYYKVLVPNTKHVSVKLTNLKNDVDLYVKSEEKPRIRSNDCYSSNSNTTDEECSYQVFGPAPGIYDNEVYILVYGFKASSYTLEVTIKDKTDVVKIKKDFPRIIFI